MVRGKRASIKCARGHFGPHLQARLRGRERSIPVGSDPDQMPRGGRARFVHADQLSPLEAGGFVGEGSERVLFALLRLSHLGHILTSVTGPIAVLRSRLDTVSSAARDMTFSSGETVWFPNLNKTPGYSNFDPAEGPSSGFPEVGSN